jgi:hypothetical protein
MSENRRLDHDLEFGWGFIPGRGTHRKPTTYLAFKDLLELITENRATAAGARIRAEPETFIEYARGCRMSTSRPIATEIDAVPRTDAECQELSPQKRFASDTRFGLHPVPKTPS